jgi:DUF3054 family protein
MNNQSVLIVGDILAIAITTLIGFATHGELSSAFRLRMFAAIIALTIAWFLLAPWLGLFRSEVVSNLKQLWRPAVTMIFAAPLAGILRGLILRADIVPVFIIVFGATSAFGMIVWRSLFLFLHRRSLL